MHRTEATEVTEDVLNR